jgi:hypothetical protein
MIRVPRVISEFLQKSPRRLADSIMTLRKKKTPPSAEPDFSLAIRMAGDQRPKNSHNRMITGIGTPSSQSKIPRPMVSSSNFSIERKTRRSGQGSGNRNGKKFRQCPVLDTDWGIGGRKFTTSEYKVGDGPVLEERVGSAPSSLWQNRSAVADVVGPDVRRRDESCSRLL